MTTKRRNKASGLGSQSRCTEIVAFATIVVASLAFAGGPPTVVSNEEWTNIQAQIEVERHAITGSDRPGRLYQAENPTQRFTAHFGAEDVVLVPRGRGEPTWKVGLRLTAWGASHDLQPVHPAAAYSENNRVELRRGPLTEWYVNTTMGLEQGFTIDAPPGDGITELVLAMTLDGNLAPVLAENRNAVTFRQAGSNTALSYSDLAAWDAIDAPLEARMELGGSGATLSLVVGVDGAVWPITVDPIITQVAKLLPTPRSDSTDAHFGRRVSVDGEFIVVGIDDRVYGEASGAAHIFRRIQDVSNPWLHVTTLLAPNGDANDYFGRSVSISGDTVVVGAYGDDDQAPNSGSVYVFRQNAGGPDTWGMVAKITADDGSIDDSFGRSVAINRDTVVVGAHLDDDRGIDSGSVYVFRRDEGGPDAWGQSAKLLADDGTQNDEFGSSVAIGRDIMLVGAEGHGSNSRGSAYVFLREPSGPGAWEQVAMITAPDGAAYKFFGRSVSISGETAVIGSPGINYTIRGSVDVFQRDHGGPEEWGHAAKLIDLSQGYWYGIGEFVEISRDTVIVGSPGVSSNQGAVHVFQRDHGGPGAWGQVTTISSSNGTDGDRFGYAVSVSGDTAVIGAPLTDTGYSDSGSSYVFERDFGGPDSWGQVDELSCPEVLGAGGDNFGRSVAISGDTAIVGAPTDLSAGLYSGAAYIFNTDENRTGDWIKTARVTPIDWSGGERFGHSVAISRDTAVIGAYADEDNGYMSGSAYVFVRGLDEPGEWTQDSKLLPPDGAQDDNFGYSVSISGDTAMVGAYGDSHDSGSVYVFSRDHGGPDSWGFATKLTPPDLSTDDYFGFAVSVKGDLAVIGAFGDDDNGSASGAAYIFHRETAQPDSWELVVKLKPSDGITQDYFGKSVSAGNDSIVVGAPGDTYQPCSAYVFLRDFGGPGAWTQVAKLRPADNSVQDDFGESVWISEDTAIVGAPRDGSYDQGAAYVFRSSQANPNEWRQIAKIVAFDQADADEFGSSTTVSGDYAIVGAWGDNHLGTDSGSAYVFLIAEKLFTDGFETGDISVWSATTP